jgi:hypothetical protein
MKITHIRLTQEDGFAVACAQVTFEDNDLPEKTIFIKTPEAHARGFFANPDAFLTGCLLPALHLGERRAGVSVSQGGPACGHAPSVPLDKGPVCPHSP